MYGHSCRVVGRGGEAPELRFIYQNIRNQQGFFIIMFP